MSEGMRTRVIAMADGGAVRIAVSDWELVANGENYRGQYEYRSLDGAQIKVLRRKQDGRVIVYGYAGDWNGGCRTDRVSRQTGFFVEAADGWAGILRAIARVAEALSSTESAGDLANTAARYCIACLRADDPVSVPAEPVATEPVAARSASSTTLASLLIEAATYCPPELQERIRGAFAGQ